MYFEGLPIAYQSVEFIFPSPEAATTFLQKIGQLARGAIQHITLQIDETVTESAPIIEAFQWIVSCESLATLRVPRFWDEVWPFGPLLSVLEKETGLQQLKRLKTVEVELPGGDRELSEGLKTILTKPL